MAREEALAFALNVGGVDVEALSRVDLEKLRMAGEHPVSNWLPRALGPMTLRPGSENLQAVPGNNQTRMVRFQRTVSTAYVLAMSALEMRVMKNGALVTVPNVATAINSGSWSDVSTSPATATGGATPSLSGTTTASAKLRQSVSVSGGDQATEHVLRVVVSAGPVILRVGTSSGGRDLIADASLDTGTHKIAFTPNAATIYIELRSDEDVTRSVSQIQFEATLLGGAGTLVLPTPWTWDDLANLRVWPSIDVLFCADGRQQQRRIERRGDRSWSVVLYKPRIGPWVLPEVSNVSLTPGALRGNTTLTASESYWTPSHVGALVEVTQIGKTVSQNFTSDNQSSDYITVVGVSAERNFFRTGVRTGFTGTLTLERSLETEDPTVWTEYATFVDAASNFAKTTVADGLTNTTAHYRFAVRAGEYTSGSVVATLQYESGVQTAVARITGYVSATVVNVEVLTAFGNTSASREWRISRWSDARGWPQVPVIHDGRMIWFEGGYDVGSVVDDFTNFDDNREGTAAPFTRSVGDGALERVEWALSLERLVAGTAGFEATLQANDLDGPLTPTDHTARRASRRGSAAMEPAEYDEGAFFLQRSGKRIYDLYIPEGSNRFKTEDVTRLNPSACSAGVVRLAVQQQPETRLYAVLGNGTALVVTRDRQDKVSAVNVIEMGGDALIEDVCIISGAEQDLVHLVVNRGGNRYFERLGLEGDQQDPDSCTLLDGYKVLTGSIGSITGATHLAGETVQVWGDGVRLDDVTLDGSGAATLGGTYSRVVYGQEFTAYWKSVKLAYAAKLGTAVGQDKIIRNAGILLSRSTLDGLLVGNASDRLGPLPDHVRGVVRTPHQWFEHYDEGITAIYADWSPDSRVILQASSADGPKTIQALVFDVETRDGA